MVAVVVSQVNSCGYCVTHHGEALLAHVRDPGMLDALKQNPLMAKVTQSDGVMLEYATKLTRSPAEVSESDVEELRRAGFTDEEILRINLIAGYFNFANRIVSGLGVELETLEKRVYKY